MPFMYNFLMEIISFLSALYNEGHRACALEACKLELSQIPPPACKPLKSDVLARKVTLIGRGVRWLGKQAAFLIKFSHYVPDIWRRNRMGKGGGRKLTGRQPHPSQNPWSHDIPGKSRDWLEPSMGSMILQLNNVQIEDTFFINKNKRPQEKKSMQLLYRACISLWSWLSHHMMKSRKCAVRQEFALTMNHNYAFQLEFWYKMPWLWDSSP